MRHLLKAIPVLASLTAPLATEASQPALSYAAQYVIPSALRIEINGLKFACPDKDTQSDCVYRRTRQHLKWMGMADDDCPIQYEAGTVRDIFMDLMSGQPNDATLVAAREALTATYQDIKTACSVTGFTLN